ncbi:hypothetical protein [Nostocoides sp. F2B08]|uniref:hypothetical protein n=1 Tax=Nostocoides sp. F2B08 TaxID=2653936 RepID=UPI001D04B906|nr:hypothetical protein [Tetrasphaera sp. F2B08]
MSDLFDEPLPERDRSLYRVGKSPARRRAGQRRGKLGKLPTLLPKPPAAATPEVDHQWVEIERYPYLDHEGRLVQEVLREECTAEGNRHKQFRQLFVTREGRRVRRKPEGFYPVLYRAPQVAAAVKAGQEVWLLEGEKDVHTAERLGLVATTNTQGGKSFPADLVDEFANALVVVVLDRDSTGWARGVDLHAKLTAVGATVRLRLPDLTEPKSDLTDHVDAGKALDELQWVEVEEVAIWHELMSVQGEFRSLQQAIEEAQGRWALAEDGQDVEDNRRFAKRWALESQIRQEALRDVVDKICARGMRIGTAWVGEALEIAENLLLEGTEAARRCHLLVQVPVPESLRLATPASDGTPAENDPPKASVTEVVTDDSDWFGHKGVGSDNTPFRVLGGKIVQWEPDRSSRRQREDWDEDDGEAGKFKTLLSMVVKVSCREYLEVEHDHDVEDTELMGRSTPTKRQVSAPKTLIAVRLRYPDEVTGELLEIRVMADQWRDHSWLESLPGPPDYDHKRAGLDQLQRAILAISENVVDEVLYRATGWRENPDGTHRFIHRRGAISAAGHEDVEVAFSGPIERYNLPDPVRDPVALRTAWQSASATMLDRLPVRIAAPLLGQVFRAVMGHNPWVLTLVGPPGSYKTSVAAKAMQHFGERWEHKKPASSMSGNGDTFNALRFKLHNAKDCLYWMDDFAPTRSWLEAQKHLEETARLIHNQEERSRSSRDGLSISDGTGPRASGLCTSEVMPRPGSGAERMLVVPLAKEDVDTALLFPLDEQLSRHQRALVMASYISWLAGDLVGKRTHYMKIADDYADVLVERAGESVRQAAAISHIWVGWVAMSDFLLQAGAITAQERTLTLRRVDEGLHEAGRAAVNPDMPRTTGARARELLAYALRQGIAYVDDVRTGECPPWPLAGRLGWRRTVTETDMAGSPSKYRLERNGIRLGYVMHDPGPKDRGRVLMCESTQLEAVLKAASATQAEKLEIDRNTACRALHDEHVLIPDTSEGRTRHTVKCRIHAEERDARMVTLYLDRVIGEEDDEVDNGPEDDGNAPDDGPQGDDGGHSPDTGGADPVLQIPGLDSEDPQPVDAARSTTQSGNSADANHAGDSEGTDHPSEENPMSEAVFTPRPHTDLDGVVGWTEQIPPADDAPSGQTVECVVCGVRSGVVISGTRVHTVCWEGSTATERASQTPIGHPWKRSRQPAGQSQPQEAPDVVDVAAAQVQDPVPAAPSSRARTSAAKTADDNSKFRAAAAVVDVDGIWLSNGEFMEMPGEGPQHAGDLVRLAQWLSLGTTVTKYLDAAAQVWVGDDLARRMGIDVETIAKASEQDRDKVTREVSASSTAVTAARGAGYSFGGKNGDALGRWTRLWKGSEKSVWVVLLAAISRDDTNVALMRDEPDHAALARRIGLLADALGHPYQLSGSTTGLDLMTTLRHRDRDRFFPVLEPCPPAQVSNVEADISWCRPPTDEELTHEWIHAYDRSGSYLAGVSGLELGVGAPTHHPDGTAFVPRMPGYWRVEIPETGDWRMPHPLDPRGLHAGKVRWVTTPAMEFAGEQGYEPEVVEAYTWSERARILDPWYERIRDARTRLDVDDVDSQVARDQLKQIYAPTIGMLGSSTHMSGRVGYAPERRHMIIAKARTNILRRITTIGNETGRYPVAVIADTVLYTSPDPDPLTAWPGGQRWLGRELGRYKVEGSARLHEHLEFLTGGNYKGKDAIVQRDAGAE